MGEVIELASMQDFGGQSAVEVCGCSGLLWLSCTPSRISQTPRPVSAPSIDEPQGGPLSALMRSGRP